MRAYATDSGQRHRTYETSRELEAVRGALREAIDPPTFASAILPGAVTGRRFVGRVEHDRFEIWVRRRNYNSLAPRAIGRLTSTARGTRVDTEIAIPSVVSFVLAGLIAFAGLGSAPVLVTIGLPPLIVVAIVLALLGLAVVVARSHGAERGFPLSESQQLREFLDELFAAGS